MMKLWLKRTVLYADSKKKRGSLMELDRTVTSSGSISSTYLLIHVGSAGGSSENLGVQEALTYEGTGFASINGKIWGCTCPLNPQFRRLWLACSYLRSLIEYKLAKQTSVPPCGCTVWFSTQHPVGPISVSKSVKQR